MLKAALLYDPAVVALACAFREDPLMKHVFPNAARRARALPYLFSPMLRCCSRYGGVQVAAGGQGAAAWLSAERFPLGWPEMLGGGMLAVLLRIGLAAIVRLERHERACERAVTRLRDPSSAYLGRWALHAR